MAIERDPGIDVPTLSVLLGLERETIRMQLVRLMKKGQAHRSREPASLSYRYYPGPSTRERCAGPKGQILRHIRENPDVRTIDVARHFGCSVVTATKYLYELLSRGEVVRTRNRYRAVE